MLRVRVGPVKAGSGLADPRPRLVAGEVLHQTHCKHAPMSQPPGASRCFKVSISSARARPVQAMPITIRPKPDSP